MDSLWDQVKTCFDTDDGSLPGIEIDSLSPVGVTRIYAMLRDRSQMVSDSPEFWSREQEASLPVDSVANAAALVVSGRADAFQHYAEGIVSAGVELPALGIFVFRDMIELDYRMGSEWGPTEVDGLFALLRECCALDTNAVVRPAETEGPPDPEAFARAWASYMVYGEG